MTYANKTTVPVTKSKHEIEQMLTRYGATDFTQGWSLNAYAMIGFKCKDRIVRFILPLPPKTEKRFTHDKYGSRIWSDKVIEERWTQDQRSRWRALGLVIKAKLEAVESGITTFEQEFLAHIVMPGGQTVGEQVAARIAQAYQTGEVVALLPERT